ncbi:MAG: SusC/RagA family TonB-linked outer membrane protein [Mucilaginibacter sp.]|uniref:SusC/RagA family TonB-linked outer membrane protein n=1 Tax=Mucilaginibacter sp. TaxID=1882438 RepID=UPI0032649725
MPTAYMSKLLLIMKLTTFILIISLMQVSAATFGQRLTLNEKNVTIERVFREIRKQTSYNVLIETSSFSTSQRINVNFKDTPLDKVLDQIISGTDLTYTIDNKEVVIKAKEKTFWSRVIETLNAINVKGRVLDENGKPLAGASVTVKGTGVWVTTNKNGEFVLTKVDDKAILVIRYVGYNQQEVLVKPDLGNIGLTVKTDELSRVEIVSTGYQTIPKERATGSFGIVTAEQLDQFPVVSVLERLQGLVPGVNISTKTTAGKSRNGTVNIRGISTLVSSYTKVNTDPLLVIDGFPSQQSITNGAFNFINPDDIEQITFLKDAAAASIWGIQAANGVIVITTKKGKRNSKPVVNFSTTFGTSNRPRATYGKMMSMTDYIALEKELIDKGRLRDPVLTTTGLLPENNSQAQAIIFRAKRGEITDAQRDQQLAALAQNDNSDQVSKLLLQPPTTHQYSLSLSGGGISNSYFVSGYFYDEDRAYKSNTNNGYSIKASNVSNLANGYVTVTSDLTVSNTRDKINGAAVRAMSIFSGGLRPYDMLEDGNGNRIYYDVATVPSVARNLESKGYLPFQYSPVDELDYSNTINNSNNINLNMAVNGKITSWLGVNVSGNIGRNFSENETYWEPNSYEARLLVNKGTSLSSTGARVYGVPLGGRLDLGNSLGRTYSLRGQVDVHKNWGNKHVLNILVGNEIREQYSKSGGELRYGYDKEINSFRGVNPSVTFKDMYGSTQTIGATSRAIIEKTTRAMSYYANGSYTFDNKYTISGSTRFDDYNLLGVDRRKRAIPLWSAGLKWNLKNEAFIKNISWLDQLSPRATYGFTGNAPQGYAPVAVINLLGNDFYTGYPYGLIATPAVDNLGWEKTRMINYGLDFSLFNGRVSGSLEYYRKHTTDIIWQMPINSTYGYSSSLFNTANLDGSGIDVGLNFIPLLKRDLRWTSTLNVSYNTNIIHDVRFATPTLSFSPENLYDGYPSDYLFSYSWAGLDATGQSLINDPKVPGKTYNVLDFPFLDIREYSGRTTSPWFGSFGNTFQYKQWELNFQFMYVFGGVFRKPSIVSIGFTNNINVGRSGDLDQRWRVPGDEAFTNVPGLIFDDNSNYNQSLARYTESNYLIRSRSNIKLQQVMLSYRVPPKLLNKYGINGLTVSAVARNLGMIWAANKEKLDPDYLYTTGNNYQLAPVPSFSFRTSLTF